MITGKRIIFFLVFYILVAGAQAQSKRKMEKLIRDNFRLATSQYKLLAKSTPLDSMPRNFNSGTNKLINSNLTWWTSGFFPATLWLIYDYGRDTSIRMEAEKRLSLIEKNKYHSRDHDLGFMIYCPFGNAYRITGDERYLETIATASETLIKRYRPSIHAIQSWDSSARFNCPVIIDNMMNLELLCWTGDKLREPKFKSIAIDHANTTLREHYRPDHSSFHVVDFDWRKGTIIAKKTAQGYADNSAWARGQSWGLYGFTMMYRLTDDLNYLQQARAIASFLIHHPHLPSDKIPYWDYNAPDIPASYRDVSSAAIMASALLELSMFTEAKEKQEYLSVATKILVSLSSTQYRNRPGEQAGFILKHSVGSLPSNSEVDVPLTYADYYFLEALLRYRQWYLH